MNRCLLTMVVCVSWAAAAYAAPVMDGTADASYGAALSVQNSFTRFGDNNLGDLIATRNGGSEIDQVFGTITGGRLYVTVTGNLENNFNKLEVFIDSGDPNGVNTIVGSQLPTGVDAFCCGGLSTSPAALQRLNGLTFDSGFKAGYYMSFTHGGEGVGPLVPPNNAHETGFWAMSAHYADLTHGTGGAVVAAGIELGPEGLPTVLRANGAAGSLSDPAYVPTATTPATTTLIGPALPGLSQGQLIDKNYATGVGGCTGVGNTGCVAKELEFVLPVDTVNDPTNVRNHRNFNNTIGLQMALNNTNIAGVSGTPGDGDPMQIPATDHPETVTTGIEFSIPLSSIGNPSGSVKLTAFVNGGGHDFGSNQFSGTGILAGNVGSLFPDLENEFPGNQYVTIPVAASVAGDYNGNGIVDAADYTIWRDTLGSTTDLRANGDNTGASAGKIDQADFTFWKSHFGGLGSASFGSGAVPEPSSITLAIVGILLGGRMLRRKP